MNKPEIYASNKHVLYKTGDFDAPQSILDRNNEVVLSLCRRCGKGESELAESECEEIEMTKPEIGSTWAHKNGSEYVVEGFSPMMIICRNKETGTWLVRELSDWSRSMILKEKIVLPKIGSNWKDKHGNSYTVLKITYKLSVKQCPLPFIMYKVNGYDDTFEMPLPWWNDNMKEEDTNNKKPWEELDNDLEENTIPASEEQSREVNEALGRKKSSMTWEDNRED